MMMYNGYIWGRNGPHMLTRMFKKACNVTSDTKEIPRSCKGFTMFPIDKCYAVHWTTHRQFFEPSHGIKVMDQIKDSYFVHIWNHLNAKIKLSKTNDLDAAYIILAKKFCPEVFSIPNDVF